MFWLKACNRCGGDLHEQTDPQGVYIICMQCGHELNADEEAALKQETPTAQGRQTTPSRAA